MKVSKLIEILSQHDEDTEVYFAYPYGDYWGNMVASKVDEVEETEIKYSDYHNQYKVPNDEEEIDEDDNTKTVVLLSQRK